MDLNNPQDKLILVLVTLFTGMLGIHNFILGEIGKGIVKIIATMLCGIGSILALIDLVKICKGTYVVDPQAIL